MTAAERRSINRANGAKSRGPLTAATKAISSRNPLKHGMCAKVHALPNEDPHEARDEATRWLAHYRPRTEHQLELVERIASACTLQRRCRRAADATVALQVLNADADLQRAAEAEVDAFRARLVAAPAAAVAGLRRTSLGCRWLIGRWSRLRDQLAAHGSLAEPDRDEMVRLCGVAATVAYTPDPEQFDIWLHCALAQPGVRPDDPCHVLHWVAEPLRASYRTRWADAAAHRAELLARIDAAVAELTAREESLRGGREAVERATAEDRALVIADPEKARLWVRYYSESNSAFYRASRELQRSLEEDDGSAMMGDALSSPNEPNDPIGEKLSHDNDASSEASAAVISECAEAETSATDRGGAGWQPAPATRDVPPAPEAASGPSPNKPNGPPRPQLSLDQIKPLAVSAAPIAGPCATALAAHVEALRQSDLGDAQRRRLTQDAERELEALEQMIGRLRADETAA